MAETGNLAGLTVSVSPCTSCCGCHALSPRQAVAEVIALSLSFSFSGTKSIFLYSLLSFSVSIRQTNKKYFFYIVYYLLVVLFLCVRACASMGARVCECARVCRVNACVGTCVCRAGVCGVRVRVCVGRECLLECFDAKIVYAHRMSPHRVPV